jgi:peptidoglycan/xylan/chitin deacetylase (PgdA/CDA1 family)
VVLTFDDWLEGHEKIVVPMLIKKDIPATFFITLNNVKHNEQSIEIINLAQSKGFEIANHTISHPDLTNIPFEKAKDEINTTRAFILNSVSEGKSLTFAYPMGTKNIEIINHLQKNHIGARSVSAPNEDDIKYDFVVTDDDYYRIKTVRVWRVLSRSKVGNWLKYAKKGGGMLTFMVHSVYNDTVNKGWDAVPEKFLSSMLDTLNAHEKDIWLCTLEDALQYHKERASATIEILSQKESELTFVVKHKLEKEKYDEELTVSLKLDGRKVDTIKQGGVDLKFTSNRVNLLVDVKPFGKKIRVKFKQ